VHSVPKAAYRSDFRENTNFCPQRDSNLGPLAQQASVLPLYHCDLQWYNRCLRVGWLNVRSLASKSTAVHETIVSKNLDVLALTTTWHHNSSDVCLRQAAPPDFGVVDAVRSSHLGYGGIALLYSASLRCRQVDLPPTTTFEALCTRFTSGNCSCLQLAIYRPRRITRMFFDDLSVVFETLVVHACPVIIGGDINVHVEDPVTNMPPVSWKYCHQRTCCST